MSLEYTLPFQIIFKLADEVVYEFNGLCVAPTHSRNNKRRIPIRTSDAPEAPVAVELDMQRGVIGDMPMSWSRYDVVRRAERVRLNAMQRGIGSVQDANRYQMKLLEEFGVRNASEIKREEFNAFMSRSLDYLDGVA